MVGDDEPHPPSEEDDRMIGGISNEQAAVPHNNQGMLIEEMFDQMSAWSAELRSTAADLDYMKGRWLQAIAT